MSINLHGAKPSNQILPEEKRVNQDSFGTKLNKTDTKDTFGEQLFIYLPNKTSLYPLIL